MMRVFVHTRQDASLFVARLAAGAVLLPHGLQMVFTVWGGSGLRGTIDTFTVQFGLPQWVAFAAIVSETLGALGLILGFLGRISALGNLIVMGGAIWMAHLQNGFFMNWMNDPARGEGFEYHILMMALLLIVLIGGSGPASVDARLTVDKRK